MKWRTMMTAPQDGSRILICDSNNNMYVAAWEEGTMRGEKRWVYAVVVTDWNYYETIYEPIAWMPLPSPPVNTGRDGCWS